MSDDKLTYIYGLVDPRNNKLRYIGKSDDPKVRFAKHIREAKRSTILHRCAWIRGLLNEGLSPKLILLMQIPSLKWQISERLLIFSLKSSNYDLTNMADGGLGGSTSRGKKRSKESRKNIQQGLKKLWDNNDQLREKQRQDAKKLWATESFRKRRDIALNNPEVKTRMSRSQKDRWNNPEIREMQSLVGKRNWQDPKMRQVMTDKIKNKWQDPVFREKMSLSHKMYHSKKNGNIERIIKLQEEYFNVSGTYNPKYIYKDSEEVVSLDKRSSIQITSLG